MQSLNLYNWLNEERQEDSMKKIKGLMLIISFLLICASCAKTGEKEGHYLAKVGKVKIMQADLEREMKSLPDFAKQIFKGKEGKEKFLNELVKKELLYQEAIKRGLDKDNEYKNKVEDFKKITLIGILLKKEIEDKAKVTDQDVKTYYDKNREDFSPFNKVRLSLIRVKTEKEAKNIVEKLKEGEDFAKIAKESSIDTNSAKIGGDLGFLARGQISPEHEVMAARLKKGEFSDPIKTKSGYDIIKVTDKQVDKVIEFEKVKDLIFQHLSAEKQKEVFDSYIESLKKTYGVEINKEALAGLSADKEKEAKEEKETEAQKQKETQKEIEKEKK